MRVDRDFKRNSKPTFYFDIEPIAQLYFFNTKRSNIKQKR